MSTLRSLICRLRADLALGDKADEKLDALLIDDINSALCAVQQMRPELFAKSKIIQLKEGDEQVLSEECGCDLLMRVEAVTTKDGRKLADVKQHNPRLRKLASRLKRCRPVVRGFHDYSVSIDPLLLNRFTVEPPVQGQVWMRVLCSGVDQFFDDLDADASMPCAVYALVLAWAKHQAAAREVDSQAAQNAAAAAMNAFINMVKGFASAAKAARDPA